MIKQKIINLYKYDIVNVNALCNQIIDGIFNNEQVKKHIEERLEERGAIKQYFEKKEMSERHIERYLRDFLINSTQIIFKYEQINKKEGKESKYPYKMIFILPPYKLLLSSSFPFAIKIDSKNKITTNIKINGATLMIFDSIKDTLKTEEDIESHNSACDEFDGLMSFISNFSNCNEFSNFKLTRIKKKKEAEAEFIIYSMFHNIMNINCATILYSFNFNESFIKEATRDFLLKEYTSLYLEIWNLFNGIVERKYEVRIKYKFITNLGLDTYSPIAKKYNKYFKQYLNDGIKKYLYKSFDGELTKDAHKYIINSLLEFIIKILKDKTQNKTIVSIKDIDKRKNSNNITDISNIKKIIKKTFLFEYYDSFYIIFKILYIISKKEVPPKNLKIFLAENLNIPKEYLNTNKLDVSLRVEYKLLEKIIMFFKKMNVEHI